MMGKEKRERGGGRSEGGRGLGEGSEGRSHFSPCGEMCHCRTLPQQCTCCRLFAQPRPERPKVGGAPSPTSAPRRFSRPCGLHDHLPPTAAPLRPWTDTAPPPPWLTTAWPADRLSARWPVQGFCSARARSLTAPSDARRLNSRDAHALARRVVFPAAFLDVPSLQTDKHGGAAPRARTHARRSQPSRRLGGGKAHPIARSLDVERPTRDALGGRNPRPSSAATGFLARA